MKNPNYKKNEILFKDKNEEYERIKIVTSI